MKNDSLYIPYVNLQKQWTEERKELLPIIDKILGSAQLVGGEALDRFEYYIFQIRQPVGSDAPPHGVRRRVRLRVP